MLKQAQESKYEEQKVEDDSSDFVDMAQFKALKKDLEKKTEAKIAKALQERDIAAAPHMARSRHKDFDSVVNEENFEKLKRSEPEIYRTLSSSVESDVKTGVIAAYKTMKSLGYGSKPPPTKTTANTNLQRPLSSSSAIGSGPLQQVSSYMEGPTEAEQEEYRKEMARSIKVC